MDIFRTSPRLVRSGLTLLEVLLAIAIFGMALVAIGELIRIGGVNAAAARDLTEAQRHSSNVMSEVSAGIIPPDATTDTPIQGYEGWLYSIESEPLEEQEGMLRVTVKVSQDPSQNSKPLTFTLVRWMTDPAAKAAAEEAAAAAEAATTSNSTSGSSTGNSGSTPSSGSGSAPSSGSGGSGSGASGTKTGASSGS